MQAGWVKIGDFRQIAGYISKTAQNRRMVSIKVEYEVVYALSNGHIADDLEWPVSAPNYPNLYILHRFSFFVMSVGRNFKFGILTYHGKFHPADENYSPKGAWSGSLDPF